LLSRPLAKLENKTAGFETLPAVLDELFGLVLEASGRISEEKNSELVQAIKDIVREPMRRRMGMKIQRVIQRKALSAVGNSTPVTDRLSE